MVRMAARLEQTQPLHFEMKKAAKLSHPHPQPFSRRAGEGSFLGFSRAARISDL
jgi:hypothetical protein